jgi:hypothetical protein
MPPLSTDADTGRCRWILTLSLIAVSTVICVICES